MATQSATGIRGGTSYLYGGQGADTRYMFDRANKFLGKYECGINGPPKECSVGTVIADTQDIELLLKRLMDCFAVSRCKSVQILVPR